MQARNIAFVADEDGHQTSSNDEENQAFANHFTGAYGSASSAFQETVAMDRKQLGTCVMEGRVVQKDPNLLPPELEMRRMFAGLNGSKAIAECGNGPDLYKAAPAQLASLYHSLFCKSVGWIRLSTTWKCGMAHPLKKRQ